MTDASSVVCVDFGSTWTKALHVEPATGDVLGVASAPTTLPEVMAAYDACLASLVEQDGRAATARTLACSSAGGGLRIAVVGNEELVTAEAGRRVAQSSGGKVVAVVAMAGADGSRDLARTLAQTRPDVVLLTGGTDGGNSEVLLSAARALADVAAAGAWAGPVVVAGNVEAQGQVSELLDGLPHVLADNVVPRIGVLAPGSARAAVREMFLEHVIGGKGLSARPEFAEIVRGATPDVVLTGVEVLAELVGDVVVVDVGGATTDVHSVVRPDPEERREEVVAVTPVTRTVEADLGMRWSAPTTVEAAGLADLASAAQRRHDEPGWLPATEAERDDEEALARAAVGLALRRHAGRSQVVVSPHGRVVERTGVDLRRVGLVVGSGGVLRHGRAGVAERVLVWPDEPGWQLPPREGGLRVAVDDQYILAAAGLLATTHPTAARALAGRLAAPPVASTS
ncbi:glutamate mutase L [Nocardioides sp. KR10-350]|uniref:glutamate mutase L n=1 Tax=Nocardioides cheoyonin TaxID=3156615 RepID=UPI0032B5D748